MQTTVAVLQVTPYDMKALFLLLQAFYEDGGHFRHLRALYEEHELTGVINRIIERRIDIREQCGAFNEVFHKSYFINEHILKSLRLKIFKVGVNGRYMEQNEIMERISELEREIATLPPGRVSEKKVKNKIYYYHRYSQNGVLRKP